MPLECEHCGTVNRLSASFCGHCGWSLARIGACEECGDEVETGQTCLNRCGESVSISGDRSTTHAPTVRIGVDREIPEQYQSDSSPQSPPGSWSGWLVLVSLALAGTGFVRFFRLGDFQSGLQATELAFLDAATDVAHRIGTGLWSDTIGQPSGFSYLLGGWVWMFGTSATATRMLSAVIGLATLVVFYMLCRSVFGRRPAVFATLMLAYSAWHLGYSSLALPLATFLLLELLGVTALLVGLAETRNRVVRRRLLVLAAMAIGSSVYFHNSFFILAIAIVMVWAREWILDDDAFSPTAGGGRVFLLVMAAIVVPYLLVLALNAGDVWDQTRSVWISWSLEFQEANGFIEHSHHVLVNIVSTVSSLLWIGEGLGRLLDPITGLLATLGLLVGLRHLDDLRHAFLWTLFSSAVLAGSLTVEHGSHTRLMVAVPAIFAYAGFALHWFLSWMEGRIPHMLQGGLVVAIFILLVLYNLTSYYDQPMPRTGFWATIPMGTTS